MSSGQPIYVIFRYDDFSSISSQEIENKLVEIFGRYKAGCTFGVIPCAVNTGCTSDREIGSLPDLPQEKIKILREAERENEIEIALHGLCHNQERGKLTEFAGLPVEEQINKVRLGKDALERAVNTQIVTFIPPWNAYDEATIQALGITGIRICCADLNGPATNDRIYLLPSTCNIRRLKESFPAIKNLEEPQIIVTEYHSFDFVESGSERGWLNLDEFANLIRWCKSQDNLRLVSIKKAVEENNDLLDKERFTANKRLKKITRIVSRIPLIHLSGVKSNMTIYWSENYCVHFQKVYRLILTLVILTAGIFLFTIVAVLKILLQFR